MEESTAQDIKTLEFNFMQALEQSPIDCDSLLKELDKAFEIKSYTADKLATALQEKLTANKDLDGLIKILAKKAEKNGDNPTFGQPIPQVIRKVTSDFTLLRFLDNCKFGIVKPSESFRRLGVLRSLCVGATYFDKTWGFGEVRKVDNFSSRVYLDFPGKENHGMSFEYAAESLKTVSADHLLAIAHYDPARIAGLIKTEPAEIIKLAIKSFGPSTVSRLQNLLDSYGLVKADAWKAFWARARAPLSTDPLVNVPAKRSDPITIRSSALLYDDEWFKDFQKQRNIKDIFETLSVYENAKDKPAASEFGMGVLTNRLTFAIDGAFLFPPPMFTRLVLMAQRLNINTPKDELVERLLDDDRFMSAGDKLSIGEAGEMISFIVNTRPEAVEILLNHLPVMNYGLMKQTVEILKLRPEFLKALQDKVRELLSSTSAPATLVVWTLKDSKWETNIDAEFPANSRDEFQKQGIIHGWALPSVYELLEHAIAICEDKAANGELLHMQHFIRTLFSKDIIPRKDSKAKAKSDVISLEQANLNCWFARTFALLNSLQQEALFMRLQTNAAMGEPKIQRALVRTMTAINPALATKKVSSTPAAAQPEHHFTSWRSLLARKEDFRQLVEVEIPANTKEIEFARGYGDLRENFEYQSAKDQQRILLARREEWSIALEKMRGASFYDLPNDFKEVSMGTEVRLEKADGSNLTYTILGEWDNDEDLGILSCLSRLAKILDGHKVGDKVSIPSVNGEEEVEIKAVSPISEKVREWIGKPVVDNI